MTKQRRPNRHAQAAAETESGIADSAIVVDQSLPEIESPIEEPKPREFVPRDCTQCTALRPKASDSYSYVYTTRGTVRYCRCKFCGNTWSQQR